MARTTGEWEVWVGVQFRASRIQADLTQAALADLASVSRGAVRNLETGSGSSIATMVKVLRVLGRLDWLELLEDAGGVVRPLEMLRIRDGLSPVRQRARKSKPSGA